MPDQYPPLDLTQFGGAPPPLDLSEFSDVAPEPPRGTAAEMLAGVKRGFYSAASGAGAAMQAPAERARKEPGAVSNLGKMLENYGTEGLKNPDIEAQPETHGVVTNFLTGAAEQTLGAAPMLAAGTAGSLIGGVTGSAPGAVIGSSAGAGGEIAAQVWHEKYHQALNEGKPDDEARSVADKSALVQGALMAGAGGVGRVLAKGGSVIRPLLGGATETAAKAGTEAVSKKFLPEFAKGAAELTGINTGLGAAGSASQAAIDQSAGMKTPTPWEAAKASILPSLESSLGFSPLAALGAHTSMMRSRATFNHLSDPTVDPVKRQASADELASVMNQHNPDAAAAWHQGATDAINSGQPVDMTFGAKEAAPAETPAVDATQVTVPDATLGRDVTIDTTAGPMSRAIGGAPEAAVDAAMKAQPSGADAEAMTRDAAAYREQQAHVEQAKAEQDAQAKAQQAQAIDNAKLRSEAEAHSQAAKHEIVTGQSAEVVPHPTVADKFTVKPADQTGAQSDSGQMQSENPSGLPNTPVKGATRPLEAQTKQVDDILAAGNTLNADKTALVNKDGKVKLKLNSAQRDYINQKGEQVNGITPAQAIEGQAQPEAQAESAGSAADIAATLKPAIEQLIRRKAVAGQLRLAPALANAISKAKDAMQSGTGKASDFIKAAKQFEEKRDRSGRVLSKGDEQTSLTLRSIANALEKEKPAAPKTAKKLVMPANPTMLQAAAAMGGFNRESVASEFGRADDMKIHRSGIFGTPSFRVSGGLSWDNMGEQLAAAGYLPKNEHGQYDKADLEAYIHDELSGNPHYAKEGEVDVAQQTKESDELDRLRTQAESFGVNWKKYKTADDLYIAITEAEDALNDAEAKAFETTLADENVDTDFDFGTPVSAAEMEAWLQGGANAERDTGHADETATGKPGEGNQRSAEGSGGTEAQGSATERQPLELARPTEERLAAQDRARAAQEATQRTEEAKVRAEQAAKDQAAVDAKIKARAENHDNFQFGENSKDAQKPVGDLFNQPAAESKPAEAVKTETPDARFENGIIKTSAIPKSLKITLEKEVDGKTASKQVNARKAMDEAARSINKLQALLECLG